MKKIFLFLCLFFLIFIYSLRTYIDFHIYPEDNIEKMTDKHNPKTRKKIVYLCSCRGSQEGSSIISGMLQVFNIDQDVSGELDCSNSKVDLVPVYLDISHKTEEEKQQIAIETKSVIKDLKPDIIIASGDTMVKYLIKPYYNNSKTPIIFCALKETSSIPKNINSNITGIVNLPMIEQVLNMLSKHSQGRKIGFLGADSPKNNIYTDYLKKHYPEAKIKLVNNMSDWQKHYLSLQKEVDIGLLGNCSYLPDWNQEKATNFTMVNAAIPWGSCNLELLPVSILTLSNNSCEQGAWAGFTALKVINGLPIDKIPVTANKLANLELNPYNAKRLKVTFSAAWLGRAKLYNRNKKNILYVNSYHSGYKWSDGIERGLWNALRIKAPETGQDYITNAEYQIKIFRLDSKRNHEINSIIDKTGIVKKYIEEHKPDIIILSDDNAVKYLTPYLKTRKDIPVLFCGVNWECTSYGLPTDTIKGMLEIDPMDKVIKKLGKYTNGDRVGYLGGNRLSNYKALQAYKKVLNINITEESLVNTYTEWQTAFLEMQNNVDIIILSNSMGLEGWNTEKAAAFIAQNATIPIGITISHMKKLGILGYVVLPEEFGWWCGNTAREILNNNIDIRNVRMTQNNNSNIILNNNLASKFGITFSDKMIQDSKDDHKLVFKMNSYKDSQ